MEVLVLGGADAARVVLFGAGAFGDPERYRPLLEQLAAGGSLVLAPRFQRLVPQEATTDELLARPLGLVQALREHAPADLPVAAVGHSIGGWAALCLAGATPSGRDGLPIEVPREPRVGRLVLYAPAAGWFQAPGALDGVTVPALALVGELDPITPPALVRHLTTAPAEVEVRVVPAGGHFCFMHSPPPGTTEDPAFDRDGFLPELARTTAEFLAAP